jgi:exosome complex RNA-binding protein Rrp42 (RNase PH superfamily)
LLDAAGIAAVAALKDARIPGFNEKTGKADYENMTKDKLPNFSCTYHNFCSQSWN